MNKKNNVRPFSMKDKIGYTLGDLGCCFTEQYRAMYLSVFYTLVLQVNPFHVGILMLITKIWDAINDPIIGAIVDSRKASKGGKFIPWIRVFSFPMAVLCILGFVNVSNLNYGLRLAYMFITYVLYEALYTCVNVPFGTLSSVMTDNVNERTALSRYRSLGGTIFMTVMVMVGPLFLYIDNKPVAGRFLMLACICALLGLLCLQITCVWCKERVEVPERPEGQKLNYLNVLKEISHNKALLGVMFFSLIGMIGASVVNGLNTYLYKDYFGNIKIQAISGMLSVLYAVIAFAITQPLANKFGKKEWCCMGAGFAAVVFGVLFFIPLHNPVMFIVINGICFLGASGMQVLVWAMVNDSIDYHELKTGERNEGIVYSTYSFFRKLASAIQTTQVVNSIWKSYTGIYFVGYGLAVAVLYFVYPLTKKKTAEMLEELKQIVHNMLKNNNFATSNQFLLESLLYSFFSILSKDIKTILPTNDNNNLYVKKAIEFIENNYTNNLKITDIAKYVCITRNYLYLLFRKHLNISPQEYLANYRITRAEQLLNTTTLSIETISNSCGYQDPLVFAKAFKAKKGFTPSQYRKSFSPKISFNKPVNRMK